MVPEGEGEEKPTLREKTHATDMHKERLEPSGKIKNPVRKEAEHSKVMGLPPTEGRQHMSREDVHVC